MLKTIRKQFIMTSMIAVALILIITLTAINVFSSKIEARQEIYLLKELANSMDKMHKMDANVPEDSDGTSEDSESSDDSQVAEGNSIEMPGDSEGTPYDVKEENRSTQKAAEEGESIGIPGNPGDSTIVESEDDGSVLVSVNGPKGLFFPEISENDLMGAVFFVVESLANGTIVSVDISKIASVNENQAARIATKVLGMGKSTGIYEGFRFQINNNGNGILTSVFLDITDKHNESIRFAVLTIIGGILLWGLLLLLVIFLSKQMIRPIARNMQQQKDFITDAGHELKTPLAIIQANTEVMEMHNGENKWSSNIKTQTERLTKLTNNLLMLAQAEGYDEKPVISDVRLDNIIDEVIFSFEDAAAGRKLLFERTGDEDIVLKGNKDNYLNMFSLLIDNAVKYSTEGTEITINVMNGEKNVTVKIINQCEIPHCEPEQLFGRFYRPEAVKYSNSGGSGIGLPSARAIAELFGGSLICHYEKDSTIVFEVTLKK